MGKLKFFYLLNYKIYLNVKKDMESRGDISVQTLLMNGPSTHPAKKRFLKDNINEIVLGTFSGGEDSRLPLPSYSGKWTLHITDDPNSLCNFPPHPKQEDKLSSKPGPSHTPFNARHRVNFLSCKSDPNSLANSDTLSSLLSSPKRSQSDNCTVPASWSSGQSALLTVLTRDLRPPKSEYVLPPPYNVDLNCYYANFLPKNLSDTSSSEESRIPILLGRSASTESLDKDRLLPLVDKFLSDDDLEFSSKNVFKYSRNLDNNLRSSDVGFYLDSSPPSCSLSNDLAGLNTNDCKWRPYFGDPKDKSVTKPDFNESSRSQSMSSTQSRIKPPLKRSHSADLTKKELRNEKVKKLLRVRFADTEGRDLTLAKPFRRTDILHIPQRVFEPLRPGVERDFPEMGTRHFFPSNFNLQKRPLSEEQRILKERKVVLHTVELHADLIIGTAFVLNLSPENPKNVFIRCTYNDWNSFDDIPAGQVLNDKSNDDQYSFALIVPRYFVKGDVLEFAVGYTGSGRIYWDDNDGKNYVVECFARQCPLSCDDRAWISFL